MLDLLVPPHRLLSVSRVWRMDVCPARAADGRGQMRIRQRVWTALCKRRRGIRLVKVTVTN